jgi:DNA-binding Lrp family transcriptional regulator
MDGTNRRSSTSEYRLDEIDQQIIHELMSDARNRSTPTIAESIGVAPGTVRSRIRGLEDNDVIEGYHAHINFERADGRLPTLFMCHVPFADRDSIARAARAIPGVINVKMLMGGRRNFHVFAVGEDPADLRRIGTTLSGIRAEIEDEMLVETDAIQPYSPFDPETAGSSSVPPEFVVPSGDVELVELTIERDAPIAELTVIEAARTGLLDGEPLIVSLKRDEELLTPHGDTTLQSGDIVTIFSCGGVNEEVVQSFVGERNLDYGD